MQRCQVRDFYPLPSSREIMPGTGFLRAPAKINRTGIQTYTARELGLDGGDKIVRLWRPPEEVAKAVKTFESVTLTDDHPPNGVDAVNWHLLAKGDVRDCTMAGEFTEATVIVRDQDQIEVVRAGKAELSCGYSFDLDMTSGTTPAGEQYDGVMREIQGNHVAIVDRGRAGSRVRIGDRGATMKTRIQGKEIKVTDKLTVPAFALDVELDEASFRQIQDAFDLHKHGIQAAKDAYEALNTQHSALQKSHQELQDAMAEMCDGDDDEDADMDGDEASEMAAEDAAAEPKKAKDGHRVGYTKDGRPTMKLRLRRALDRARRWKAAALDTKAHEKLAEERAKVIADTAAFVGEEFDAKGKTVHEIRVAAIDAALKDESLEKVAKAALAGAKPEKLTEDAAKRALDVLLAVASDASIGDDGGDPDLSRAIAGDGEAGRGKTGSGLSGRNIFLARNAADSRAHRPTAPTRAQG